MRMEERRRRLLQLPQRQEPSHRRPGAATRCSDYGAKHMADAYAARLNDVIDTLCLENGKTRPEAAFEADRIVSG